MENILFSILVPVYNVEKYIHRCIDSVLEQTYSNFELILVDDGTPDNSGHICDEYASKDPRVVVIHKENGGQMSARIAAINVASGDWCIFLDSDDYLSCETLEVLAQKIEETQSDCIYYGWNSVDNNGNFISRYDITKKEFFIKDKRELYNLVFLNSALNTLWSKAIKRNLLSDENFSSYYHIRFAEDLLQSIGIYQKAEKVLFLPRNFYNYRVNPSSVTHTLDHKKYRVNFTVREKVLEFLRGENVWQEEDYANYWAYCVSLFVAEVLMVANFDTDYKTIRAFFDEMSKTDYYLNFLASNKYNEGKKKLSKKEKLFYFLFRSNQYWLLTMAFKARKFVRCLIK